MAVERAETRSGRRRGAPRSKIEEESVRLVWPGRRWRIPSSNDGSGPQSTTHPTKAAAQAAPRVFDVTGDATGNTAGNAPARVIHGDVLDLVRALADDGLSGKVDLVYVDPPYASDRDYVAESRLDGPADGRIIRSHAYEDTWNSRSGGLGAYLDMLAPRLEALAGLLGPRGSIWVHLDWRAAYLVRAILDEILGRDAFLNEIVWRRAPNLGRQATSGQFGRTLDTLVVYGKSEAILTPPTRLEPIDEGAIRFDDEGRPFTSAPRGDYTDASIAKLEAEGRVHRTTSGRVYIKYFLVKNEEGVWCRERRVDALWTDIAPLRHSVASERTGYPTQKPRALLERIIACGSPPGGLVVDGFAGSGTTAIAAHALGRRSAISDRSPVAIATARARLMREGAKVSIERAANVPEPDSVLIRIDVAEASLLDVRVTLVEPSEPLAWAVGTLRDGVFRCAWHAERVHGAKAIPATREAVVARADAAFVRVWGDDGTVSTTPILEQPS